MDDAELTNYRDFLTELVRVLNKSFPRGYEFTINEQVEYFTISIRVERKPGPKSVGRHVVKPAIPLVRLGERQKVVLNLVAQGYSNKEIANRCSITESTVKAHLRSITEKLGVKNRAEAAVTAIAEGLIEISADKMADSM